jgi:hypothetical protein
MGPLGAQTLLDPREMREWMPNYTYGAHAFGLPSFQSLIDDRDRVLPWIKEYSPIEQVSRRRLRTVATKQRRRCCGGCVRPLAVRPFSDRG